MKKTLLLLMAAASLFAADYRISKAENVVIDGKLDEQSWSNAAVIDKFILVMASGKTVPSEATEVKFLCDDDAFYFGFKCYDVTELKDDLKGDHSNPWKNDLVEIFMAPTESRDEYYQFALSAGGAYWSQYFAEAGNIRPDPYKPGFDVATSKDENAWYVEARIPFAAFYMTSSAKMSDTWAINVCRYSPAKKGHPTENSSWAALFSRFHEISKFNSVSGIPVKPAKYDISIPSAKFDTTGKLGTKLIGTLSVQIDAETAPEGKYVLSACNQTIPVAIKRGTNIAKLQASFEQDGRSPVKMILKNDKDEVVCDRSYPVFVDATAMSINFTSPQYGGNFYPGEDATHLTGYVKVNTGAKSVKLQVGTKSYNLDVIDGKAEFDIDVEKYTDDIPVSCGDVSVVVKHVNDAKAWIHDGKIFVEGEKQYLLGWYGGTSWIYSDAAMELFPNKLSKHPVNYLGWINLEPGRLMSSAFEQKECTKDAYPSQELLDKIKAVVEKSVDAPNISYYLCDEPECRGVSPIYLKYLYKYIKQLDPKRLVEIISRDPVTYIDCCDIINPHPYISPSNIDGKRILGTSIARLRDMCAKEEALGRKDKALMLTPQVHSYSFNDIYADYPSFDETNVSIWSSICHGGQGITPYIWYDHMSRPGVSYGCDYIYQSLDRLQEMLVCDDQSRLEGDEGRLFVNGKKLMYLVCNVYNEERTFEFDTKCKKLFRFRSNEVVTPLQGHVTLKMKPYEVYVLTSEKMDKGLESEYDVRVRIDKEEYDRTHRGNILFGKARSIEVNFPPSKPYDWQRKLEQQDKMFDGNTWVSAWIPRSISENAWYEMNFTFGETEFTKARIYGVRHQDLKFKIWKDGQWVAADGKRTSNGAYELLLDFGKKITTSKVRLEFPRKDPQLYEFELLK